MKIHGLDLDNSPLISQDKSLRYAQNIAIGEGNQSYINEDGFELKINVESYIENLILKVQDSLEFNTTSKIPNSFKIIGTIPTNIGVVLFCVFNLKSINSKLYTVNVIVYIETDNVNPTIKTIIYDLFEKNDRNNLNFNIDRNIKGEYIYNYKNELIIVFTEGLVDNSNETRIINLNNPEGCYSAVKGDNNELIYKVQNSSMFNLIPNVEYPNLTIAIEKGGNLKTGAYQIAISYKLQDGTYTNYSILSTPVIISGNYNEDHKPNSEINKHITVQFDNNNDNLKYYKLAIVHCTDTTQLVYETYDISLNEHNTFIISRLDRYSLITLDDIFIKNISYIKEETLVNYNNNLIRGNVQTLDYKDIDAELKKYLQNNIIVKGYPLEGKDIINTDIRYFKKDEIYVLYAGLFDYKGDLINIYPINNNRTNLKRYVSNNIKGFQIQKSDNRYIDVVSNTDLINIAKSSDSKYVNIVSLTFHAENGVGIGDSNQCILLNSFTSITELHNTCSTKIKCSSYKFTKGLIDQIIYLKSDNDTDYCTLNVFKTTGTAFGSIYKSSGFKTIHPITNEKCIAFKLTLNIEDYLKNNDYIDLAFVITIETYDEDYNVNLKYRNYNYVLEDSQYYGLNVQIDDIGTDFKFKDIVKSIAYFYIEHNTYNSKILSQCLVLPDTNIVNFAANQKYDGQFKGENALRFYPFEYLFNKISKIKANIQWVTSIGALNGKTDDKGVIKFEGDIPFQGELDSTYAVRTVKEDDEHKFNFDGYETDGIKILDCDIENLNEYINSNTESDVTLEYISADNTSQQNIAGDSYYRTKDLTIVDYPESSVDSDDENSSYTNIYLANLINPAEILYSDVYDQKLQIASSIIPFKSYTSTTLIGDTYLSYLTLRVTTPATGFIYGDNNFKEGDSNSTVFRHILTFPIESKYNIKSRYSDNVIDKPYFLHNAKLEQYIELLGASYKVDNYINTEVGKGYNTVYNENGIENFIYFENLPGVFNHPHRIIRSLKQNSESTSLNWRIFKTDDYKDLPFNRGSIISLKTDNKNLYIQQKYGLHLLQQRDQLNNDDANNSYLGTSDLFNMEPKEIIYSPSGYIGCENDFDTNINVTGYIVIDIVHRKIFIISEDKPLEISNLKTKDFFDKFLSDESGTKRVINYSEDRSILYITQSNSNIEKTMSFSPLNKAWVSFHTYIPDFGFVNRNGLFWGKNGKLYSPTLNRNKGLYFDNQLDNEGNPIPEPSVIQFILNENTVYNKLLKTIVWKDQVSYKGDDYIQHFFKETIDHIMVHNFDQCSGKLNVAFNESKKWWNGDTGTNKINLWRFNKLFDLVKPDDTSLFMKDVITPDPNKLKVDYKWYNVNRFICQFIYLTLWCNNSNDHEWELIDAYPEWQLDNRNDQNYNTKDNN